MVVGDLDRLNVMNANGETFWNLAVIDGSLLC
jgi:hypothetical protein